MRLLALYINVGWARRDRAVAIKLFSFVDVLFVGEPPSSADGGQVAHDENGRDLFSCVVGSGVEVYVCSCLRACFGS